MGLFGRFVCENESFSSMKKALSSSPDELWDEYKAMDKRLQEAEATYSRIGSILSILLQYRDISLVQPYSRA